MSLVSFDDDLYIDYRARRPTLELRDGEAHPARVGVARDAVRPDARRPRRRVAQRARAGHGVAPFLRHHRRPRRHSSACAAWSASAPTRSPPPTPDPSCCRRRRRPRTCWPASRSARNSVDVPAGVAAALEQELHGRGIPSVGVWAQVPHYVASMSYPAASVALLDGLATAAGIAVDAADLRREAVLQRERLDQLVEANPEHQAMVEQFERLFDDAERVHRSTPPQRPRRRRRARRRRAGAAQRRRARRRDRALPARPRRQVVDLGTRRPIASRLPSGHEGRRRTRNEAGAGRRSRPRNWRRPATPGAWTAETSHDPFLPLPLAAEHTTELELGTSIAVAFARNPMLAGQPGLGPADVLQGPLHPRPRQPDQAAHHEALLDAVEPPGAAHARDDPGHPGDLGHVAHRRAAAVPRRVLHAHADDAVLHARRRRTSTGSACPKIFLAGVGELMTEVAGETCDGFLCHGFTTERYLREVTIPALERGRREGRQDDGRVPDRRAELRRDRRRRRGAGARPPTGTRQQIAFYGSTPAYRPVLELHGWGGLQDELNALSKQGEWVQMGKLIDDEILNTFAVVGPAGGDRARAPAPLRRRRRPHQLLRPLPERPGPLAPGPRRHQGRRRSVGRPLTASGAATTERVREPALATVVASCCAPHYIGAQWQRSPCNGGGGASPGSRPRRVAPSGGACCSTPPST